MQFLYLVFLVAFFPNAPEHRATSIIKHFIHISFELRLGRKGNNNITTSEIGIKGIRNERAKSSDLKENFRDGWKKHDDN